MPRHPIKLRALDAEDLALLSALLQDALVEPGKLGYDRAGARFGGPLVRFLHEEAQAPALGPLRQSAALLGFETVRAVRSRGLDRGARRPLELLAVASDAAGRTIDLLFAGGGAIRLAVETIDCRLSDVGEPWVTRLRPRHAEEP
jgi:hypothetical protein